jgi:hypothetical protein
MLQVDTGFSLGDMLGTVLTFHGVNPDTASEQTMPVVVDADNYLVSGYDYGSVELTSEPQDLQVTDNFLGLTANQDTMTGKTLPPARAVTVSVLNGTGLSGQAAATGAALSALGLDVTGTGDAAPLGSVSETTVTYSTGHEADAERVAHDLDGTVVMGTGATSDGADVTVTTGTDFSVRTPPTPSSSATTSPASSTPGTATTGTGPASTDSGILAPPSPATQALAPFDPRACTASGGEGT